MTECTANCNAGPPRQLRGTDHNLLNAGMETTIKISQSPFDLARDLAADIAEMINRSASGKRPFTFVLSGGSTPKMLFNVLADNYSDSIPWSIVHFFWGDERCVPPGDPESNYGMTERFLLSRIPVPGVNIHRIRGEDDPLNEAKRYSSEILLNTLSINNVPVFDLVILGIGEDGHTASIFPGNKELLVTDKIMDLAIHPVTLQKRLSLSAPVINNASNIVFLVSGTGKAGVVADVIENKEIVDYPASFIQPSHGHLRWYLDSDSASLLGQWA